VDTWAPAHDFVDHPAFADERQKALAEFEAAEIDDPIRDIVDGLMALPHCFTLQSCYGHFVHSRQPSCEGLERLPPSDPGPVLYRIAYLALCLESSRGGAQLRAALEDVAAADSEFVQFGSPDWFWERQINSFSLQVEPLRLAHRDSAIMDYGEALAVQAARDRFFEALRRLLTPVAR
jgi:hypothetical protein